MLEDRTSFLASEKKIVKLKCRGSSIKYLRKIFRKTNISTPLIRTAY